MLGLCRRHSEWAANANEEGLIRIVSHLGIEGNEKHDEQKKLRADARPKAPQRSKLKGKKAGKMHSIAQYSISAARATEEWPMLGLTGFYSGHNSQGIISKTLVPQMTVCWYIGSDILREYAAICRTTRLVFEIILRLEDWRLTWVQLSFYVAVLNTPVSGMVKNTYTYTVILNLIR